jgi:apolipoprotein N-acyltransferase
MNFDYERDPGLQSTLREFTIRNRVTLILNSWAYPTDRNNAETVHNSAIAIGPSGDRIYRYDKIALVPFGEYVPARGLIPLMDRIPALVADVTPGKDLTLGVFGPARLGVAICFETIRPDIARQMRRQGASALVQISNEAWFGPTAAPRQMLAHAVFRAVENNIDLIRATNSGLSAKISAHGIVSGETSTFETATRRWRIPSVDKTPPMTFYSRHGDVFAGVLTVTSLFMALGGAALEIWKRKKSEND